MTGRWHPACRTLVLVAVLARLAASQAQEEMAVPIEVQVPLLLRLLQFDRNLSSRATDGTVALGIAYQERFKASREAKDELVAVIGEKAGAIMGSTALHCVPLALDGGLNLPAAMAANRIRLLYITPLRAPNLVPLLRVSQEQKVLTLTGVTGFVKAGVAVGTDSRGGKPLLLINWSAAKAGGAELHSRLSLLKTVVIIE